MKALVLGLYSVTPVHPGSGSEISVIDLPIQRERHTGFPVVWGQSLKGVLRGKFREKELSTNWKSYAEAYIRAKLKDKQSTEKEIPEHIQKYVQKVNSDDKDRRDPPLTEIIFGPPTGNASEHGGSISVGDAKILLFPVRSVKGVFAYVTCPFVLRRFVEDMKRAGLLKGVSISDLQIGDGKAGIIVGTSEHFNAFNNTVVLEDVPLTVESKKLPNEITGKIKSLLPEDVGGDFEKRLVIVSDDLFSMLVKTTTEIVTRIRINPSTGTVDTGALWYEEFLPADTLMYSVLVAGEPRVKLKNGNVKLEDSNDIVQHINDKFNGEFVQLGGDETVGKGFMRVSILPEGGGNEKP